MARQVVAELVDGGAPTAAVVEPGIVLAADLTPADTAALDRELVHGLATAYGGPTSHSAILARSLGIPAAVGVGEELLEVPEGTPLVLDGDAGAVYVDPAPALVREYERRSVERKEEARRALASAAAAGPDAGRTADRGGRQRRLARGRGCRGGERGRGCGASAHRVPLPGARFAPDARTSSTRRTADMAERLQGRPLILRTLDVGADKPLPYLPRRPEANPFLGVRGIRLGLAQPELLETQLRAALRVAAAAPAEGDVSDGHHARRVPRGGVGARPRAGAAGGRGTREMEVGIMVEVPAAALAAEAFAPEVDFFSIGTNDLVQYTMAAERGNEAVAGLADGLHPAVLRLIRGVVAAAEAHGKWVGVCGELGADPLAVPVLVGLGVSELSVNPPAIPATKEAVRQVDAGEAGLLAREALRLASADDVRGLVAGEAAEAPLAMSEPSTP